MIHISQDGTGDFTSIQAALNTIPSDNQEEIILYLHKGVYHEQVTVAVPHVTFLGESRDETVITGDLSARTILEDGMKRGTFRTYTCFIDSHHFTARNMTFENAAGPGPQAGQALALYVDGDVILFDDCRFLGNQDTLFTGPLPPKEIEPNGFIGPKQFAPRINGRHCYQNCYIEGDVDFIFGSATAYFEGCTFFSKDIHRDVNGYVTAASTPEGQAYGYVMKNCRFEGNCPDGTVYLGRPWREFAQTVLIDCYMGAHIHPEGWHDWNKPHARQTALFAEYGSYGPGAVMERRPDWIKRLSPEDLSRYERDAVLS